MESERKGQSKQLLHDLNIKVVDDGSSDGTVDWIEAELRGGGLPGDMVRLVKMGSNGGATRARNVGIRASRGAVVTTKVKTAERAWGLRGTGLVFAATGLPGRAWIDARMHVSTEAMI